jgi:hypothetical protein
MAAPFRSQRKLFRYVLPKAGGNVRRIVLQHLVFNVSMRGLCGYSCDAASVRFAKNVTHARMRDAALCSCTLSLKPLGAALRRTQMALTKMPSA